MTSIRLMEAKVFGGIDLVEPSRIMTGIGVPVIVRDMGGKTVQAICTVNRVGPRRSTNKIEIWGIFQFPDGEEKDFHGILEISTTVMVEY